MARRARALVAIAAGIITSIGAFGAPAGWAHRVLGDNPQQNDKGLYTAKIDGRIYQTHGVDEFPPSDEPDDGVAEGPLGERPPRCVTGGKYVHPLYAYTPGTAPASNWQSTIGEHIRTVTRQNNYFLNQQSLASSGGQVSADLKVRCNVAGQVQVDAFEIVPIADDPKTGENESSWGVSDWRRIMAAGAQAGFSNVKVDYEVFTNAPGASGIATWRPDERLISQNENNNPGYPFGAGWAIVYASSWDRTEVSLHELGHTMGAVGNGAEHSSGAAHCWEEQDLMCYRDGGPLMPSQLVYNCSAVAWDCGYDDYFDAKTESGEYLASHWNLGNPLNAMIAFTGPGGTPTPTGPTADFTYNCSITSLPFYRCTFASTSQEGDAAIGQYRWSFDDGATGTGLSPVHVFNSLINAIKVLTRGVTLTVVDTNGIQDTVTKQVRLSRGGGGTGGPQASFWKSCNGLECEFQDTSDDGAAEATGWRWDFGDGSTKTGAKHPSHAYGKPGTYTVSLTVTDAAGKSDTASRTFDVDNTKAGAVTAVKIARIRPDSGGKVAVTVRAGKGAHGRAKVTSRQHGKTQTESVRFRGQASRIVKLRVPAGTSQLLVKFRANGGSSSGKARYRVKNLDGTLKLRRL